MYAVDGGGKHPIHGAVWQPGDEPKWWQCEWEEAGDAKPYGCTKPYDLISEWVDRPVVDWSKLAAWHRWVAVDEMGEWFSFGQKPTLGLAHWMIASGCDYCPIPPQYSPTFSGDWKDSLVERPTE